jgi:hypothetical protein
MLDPSIPHDRAAKTKNGMENSESVDMPSFPGIFALINVDDS